jgi:hypothetical protein
MADVDEKTVNGAVPPATASGDHEAPPTFKKENSVAGICFRSVGFFVEARILHRAVRFCSRIQRKKNLFCLGSLDVKDDIELQDGSLCRSMFCPAGKALL